MARSIQPIAKATECFLVVLSPLPVPGPGRRPGSATSCREVRFTQRRRPFRLTTGALHSVDGSLVPSPWPD
jgi:hypothetical protein